MRWEREQENGITDKTDSFEELRKKYGIDGKRWKL